MPTMKKAKIDRTILARARETLAFAEELAKQVTYAPDLSNALFSPGGKALQLFPTPSERKAFFKTKESKKIDALIASLPYPPARDLGDITFSSNATVTMQLPLSVYQALVAEARAEGVTPDQLCAAKITTQLRTIVQGMTNGTANGPPPAPAERPA